MSNVSTFHIRKATHEDADCLMSMIRELAAYENMESGVKIGKERLADDLRQNKFHCFLPCLDSRVIGYATFVFVFDLVEGKQVYLEDLYIREEHRGKGYGCGLWDALKEESRQHECSSLKFSVLKWNTPSIKFYLNRGAKNISESDNWEVFRHEICS